MSFWGLVSKLLMSCFFMAPQDFIGILLTIQTKPFEHCGPFENCNTRRKSIPLHLTWPISLDSAVACQSFYNLLVTTAPYSSFSGELVLFFHVEWANSKGGVGTISILAYIISWLISILFPCSLFSSTSLNCINLKSHQFDRLVLCQNISTRIWKWRSGFHQQTENKG